MRTGLSWGPLDLLPAACVRGHERLAVRAFVTTCRTFTRAALGLALRQDIVALHRDLLGAWVEGARLETLIPLNGRGGGMTKWRTAQLVIRGRPDGLHGYDLETGEPRWSWIAPDHGLLLAMSRTAVGGVGLAVHADENGPGEWRMTRTVRVHGGAEKALLL
ncbi:hypothetical protein ACFRJ3_35660 [Streptomyces sp. NPDC056696]|uniref:hypothetical protein n=1 Tax=Streptomyces sp. NPDC056696 TaxID=3345914 RepID=UPI003695BCC3